MNGLYLKQNNTASKFGNIDPIGSYYIHTCVIFKFSELIFHLSMSSILPSAIQNYIFVKVKEVADLSNIKTQWTS